MPKLDIAMTDGEREEFLRTQWTIRVATVDAGGLPHVVPLWFVWHGGYVFLNSTQGNVTVGNIHANPNVAGVVDDGHLYGQLRGVLIHGTVELMQLDDPEAEPADALWSQKYMGGNPTPYRRWKDRTWMRLAPTKITSWDFRKIPEAKARAKARSGVGGG